MPGYPSATGWMDPTVQIQDKSSSTADIGFYFLPESLCLSLIESNLEGDRSQGVAALGPPSCAQVQFMAWCA